MHERHAQHVGMHVVESVELIHGSAVLQSTHLDQIRALCDVCATCAAPRTIAHSSVWSVSKCGGGGLCWRRRRLFSFKEPQARRLGVARDGRKPPPPEERRGRRLAGPVGEGLVEEA